MPLLDYDVVQLTSNQIYRLMRERLDQVLAVVSTNPPQYWRLFDRETKELILLFKEPAADAHLTQHAPTATASASALASASSSSARKRKTANTATVPTVVTNASVTSPAIPTDLFAVNDPLQRKRVRGARSGRANSCDVNQRRRPARRHNVAVETIDSLITS